MIKVNCPNCGVRLTAPDDFVGRAVNCQKCNTKFILSKRWMNEPLTVPGNGNGDDVGHQPQESEASDSVQSNEPPKHADEKSASAVSGVDASSSEIPANRIPTEAVAEIPTAILPGASGLWAKSLPVDSPAESQLESIAKQTEAVRRGAPGLDGYVEARSFWEFFDFRFRRYLTPWILRISWLLILVLALIWFLIICYTYLSSLLQLGQSGDLPVAIDTGSGTSFTSGEPARISGAIKWSPFFVESGVFLSAVFGLILTVLWIRVLFESIMMLFSMGNTLRTIDAKRLAEKE